MMRQAYAYGRTTVHGADSGVRVKLSKIAVRVESSFRIESAEQNPCYKLGLKMKAVVLAAAAAVGVQATSPIAGFRPPSIPILMQSPEINVWSNFDAPNQGATTHWEGGNIDFMAAARVDGTPYLLMGVPNPAWSTSALTAATQLSVTVWATQVSHIR